MKKRILSLLVVFVFIIALMTGCSNKGTNVTVEVTHADQTVKTFKYTTEAEMLGEVLLDEGLVEGSDSDYGLVIEKVDGEQAIYETDGAYWSLLIDGEYAQTGADSTPVEEGVTYSLVYTLAN